VIRHHLNPIPFHESKKCWRSAARAVRVLAYQNDVKLEPVVLFERMSVRGAEDEQLIEYERLTPCLITRKCFDLASFGAPFPVTKPACSTGGVMWWRGKSA